MSLLLETSFVDVRGDMLRWTLDPVRRSPLAVRDVGLAGGLVVSLRVLGASHQVLVDSDAGDRLVTETVACDLADAPAMPGHWNGRPGYSFTSFTEHLAPDAFADRVNRVVRRLDGRSDALVARFPGVPDAVTALAVEPDRGALSWRTWHAYPQTGEIVRTATGFDPTTYRHRETAR